MTRKNQIPFFILLVASFFSCKDDEKLFAIRNGAALGIDFENTIITSDTFNALSYEYIYNGGGVGVGDFNNDGLSDLFFGGNQVSSELYLNTGELEFKNITTEARVSTSRWVTGVSVVDVNLDGWQDIYLCVGGKTSAENRRNLLYINQGSKNGIPQFEESAKDFGVDSDRYSTMAAFLDFDKDGDLDMYLVNNWLESFNRNNLRPKRTNGEAESTDQLFRNDGSNRFTDISREAGILIEGYGLGVTVCDINQDSWPDIYVANDFMSNDLLWINQHDGTFKNQIREYLKHQTHNGMGVDVADFNNDALADIMVVDMLPPGHVRQKMMTPGQNFDHFHMSERLGYEPQYMRNTLQLNRGKMPDGRILFSEIAFLSGVAQTDWSWAPLFADFDNDGLKDLFIANGYRKDVTNLDFIFFAMENDPFGTPEARNKKWNEQFNSVPDVKLSNYLYRNSGSLIFEDKTKEWGVHLPTFSNGAAYADLDNDGDLDLITNNIDQEVILYENLLNKQESGNHFLRLGTADASTGNEKIWVYTGDKTQYIERTPFRGFQSTVENYVHFGVGEASTIDSMIIQWPDGTNIKARNVPVDTLIFFSKGRAKSVKEFLPDQPAPALTFKKVNLATYRHTATDQSDIKSTRTLLHELSRYGPCLAKGDVNGDQLDDFFVGSEPGNPAKIFIQQGDGSFKPSGSGFQEDEKDGYALFFDADGDHDLDLYTAKASTFSLTEAKVHKLYFNDGKGIFTFDGDALPDITISASCVESADYDNDGDMDLFVGGRFKTGGFPLSPNSYILKNEGGKFVDVTNTLNAELAKPGMVSSAVWTDINNDRKTDLIFTGEWQPIRIFLNEGDKFTDVTSKFGLGKSNGWWNCIQAADLNSDGFTDLVVGNTGKNSYFRPSEEHPVQVVAKDFDTNESMDPIITYYNPVEKERFIVHNRLVLIDQIPGIKRRFETFTQYATRPFTEVFSGTELEGAFTGSAYQLASVVLINNQGMGFTMVELPDIAQVSTVTDILVQDLDEDGAQDLIVIGNMYAQETLFGRYDASIGTVLLGDGKLNWKEVPPHTSAFVVDKDARYIESLRTAEGPVFVITNNNDSIQFFALPNRGFAATNDKH